MKCKFISVLLFIISVDVLASTYSGKITKIQAEGIGDAYNTLYLNVDVTDSPCESTNQVNRFTIVNESQQSVALAAAVAGKRVDIQTKGVCNANIEEINYIMIYVD